MTDLLIRGGSVIDGTGSPAVRGDVAVTNGKITDVGTFTGRRAMRMIDARGMVVAPGFIDIHSHSDESMFVNSAMESALHQGVTLVVCGNCGGSSAPVHGLAADEADREYERLGVTRTWSSFYEYSGAVEENGSSINVCSFVGHGTLRMCVMGAEARPPTSAELAEMRGLLGRAMDEGAIGLASGLIYPPSAYGTTDELASLCEIVRARGGLYASHIRNEGAQLLEAVEENLEIGRRSKARVQLSHHKASGRMNWGKVKESVAKIEDARAAGLDVQVDQYPYTASSTGLAVTIPNWVHEGGSAKLTERLRDTAVRRRIRDEDTETGRAWDRIVIARARHRPEYSGRSVADLATEAGKDPLEWTCDTLVEHEGAVDIIHHSMSEDDVRFVMAQPWIAIGSDSRANAPYGPLSFGKPHPRSYGTFPRVLGRYVRDERVLALEDAVRKMTSLTARHLRLRDRGEIRVGAWADLVVFDPDRVNDVATYDDPHRYPEGIEYVVVNGALAVDQKETTLERAGRFLRQGRDLGAA
ncbi:MAG TPA: D-aminoacylase [Candidatus Limnocylindrales bacterium]|nr:D-aminoacylase [Candidatus Limnocylindrales bacterium]